MTTPHNAVGTTAQQGYQGKHKMRVGVSTSQRIAKSSLPVTSGEYSNKYEKKKGSRFVKRIVRNTCVTLVLCVVGTIFLLLIADDDPTRKMTTYEMYSSLEADFRKLFRDPNYMNHRKYVTWLTKDTYDDFLKENRHVFIDFFSHNCIWSKRMYPLWVEFATDAHGMKLPVAIGAVDCVDEEEVCAKAGINAFPILKFFVNGTTTAPYKGKRSKVALLNYAFAQSQKS